MGFLDTKPNLDYKRFEQQTSDILILSGTTCICKTGRISSDCGYAISGFTALRFVKNITNVAISNSLFSLTGGCSNIAIGKCSMYNTKTGFSNIAIGESSQAFNVCGTINIGIGPLSLKSNCSGSYNIGIGHRSIECLTVGCYNIALGTESAAVSCTSCFNIAIGCKSLTCNSGGCFNTSIGHNSLTNSCNKCGNIAIGYCSMYDYNDGNNIAIGNSSLLGCLSCLTPGTNNVVIGHSAMRYGSKSTVVGNYALNCATGTTTNDAFGAWTLCNNLTGNYNVALGLCSLFTNVSGNYNVGVGYLSMNSNRSGSWNVGVGQCSLYQNCCGNTNIGIGFCSLYSNTRGCYNTAIGGCSLSKNTIGCNNTAVGICSMTSLESSCDNTSIGACNLLSNTLGYGNTAVGAYSQEKNICGNRNVSIGACSLYANTCGSANIGIGNSVMNSICGLLNNNISIGECAMFTSNIRYEWNSDYTSCDPVPTYNNNNIAIGVCAIPCAGYTCDNVVIGHCSGINLSASTNSIIIGTCNFSYGPSTRDFISIGKNEWSTIIESSPDMNRYGVVVGNCNIIGEIGEYGIDGSLIFGSNNFGQTIPQEIDGSITIGSNNIGAVRYNSIFLGFGNTGDHSNCLYIGNRNNPIISGCLINLGSVCVTPKLYFRSNELGCNDTTRIIGGFSDGSKFWNGWAATSISPYQLVSFTPNGSTKSRSISPSPLNSTTHVGVALFGGLPDYRISVVTEGFTKVCVESGQTPVIGHYAYSSDTVAGYVKVCDNKTSIPCGRLVGVFTALPNEVFLLIK